MDTQEQIIYKTKYMILLYLGENFQFNYLAMFGKFSKVTVEKMKKSHSRCRGVINYENRAPTQGADHKKK